MVPRRIPDVLSPYRFGDPTPWLVHLVVFGRRARAVQPARESFLGLHPRSRVSPGAPRRRPPASFGSLEVFFPFSATRYGRATTPGVASSGSCCVLAVPAGFDALLPSEPPWLVSSRRARGVFPSELDTTRIAFPSRRSFPSCDWRCGVTLPNGVDRSSERVSPGPYPAPSPFGFSAWCGGRRVFPWGIPCVPDRRRPVGDRRRVPDFGSGAASLQGVAPLVALGCRVRISAGSRHPGSPGLLPPWGLPLPGLGLIGRRTRRAPFGVGTRDVPGIAAPAACLRTLPELRRSASSPVLQAGTLPGSLPCTPEFQRTREIGWPLSRLPAPPRFSSSSLPSSRPSGVRGRVSDRPSKSEAKRS